MVTGDIILGFDGGEIHGIEDLLNGIHAKNVGDTVKVLILRSGREYVVEARLDRNP